MKGSRVFLWLIAMLLTACSTPAGSERPGVTWGPGSFGSLGEQIYFTAIDADGDRIPYTGGPDLGGMMMSGYLACASCHGPRARGGVHVMHMQTMDAPDIRWSALTAHEEAEEQGEGHEDEHEGYGLETFRLAVVEGRHPDGEPLSEDMPRWDMSGESLTNLAEYLQSLP